MATIELRMRGLTRTIPPTDIQLYYQVLLIGRRELLCVPDRRMDTEMTLLRVLAFHPCMPLPGSEVPHQSFTSVAPAAVMTPAQMPPRPQSAPQQAPTVPLSEIIGQVLATRQQLQRVQGATKAKRSEPATATRARPMSNAALGRLASITSRVQARPMPSALEKTPVEKKAYRWKATTPMMQQKEMAAMPRTLREALEHERTSELATRLAAETIERSPWAAQASRLSLPKLVEQVALDAQKEGSDSTVCLHLRPSQRHLNNHDAQQGLAEVLSTLKDSTIELTIIEDDDPAVRTSLEWRQAAYEGELAQACEPIIADNNIQTLRRFFNTELDEESTRLI